VDEEALRLLLRDRAIGGYGSQGDSGERLLLAQLLLLFL